MQMTNDLRKLLQEFCQESLERLKAFSVELHEKDPKIQEAELTLIATAESGLEIEINACLDHTAEHPWAMGISVKGK